MDENNEILVELCANDIKKLYFLYENYVESFPLVFSFLKNCVRSKEIEDLKNYVQIYVIKNDSTLSSSSSSWQKDGTFIASMPEFGHDIVCHSLETTGEKLINAFRLTKKFPFLRNSQRKYTLFFSVHENFSLKLVDLLKSELKQDLYFYEANLWKLEKQEALVKFENLLKDHDDDVFVQKIQSEEDVRVIDEFWPHKSPTSYFKHLQWLKLGTGFGVYTKSDKKLISWVTSSCLGQFSALQTRENYQKKGYAKIVVKFMAYYLAKERDSDICVSVFKDNFASENLFKSLGFKKSADRYHFIRVMNRN